MVMLQKKTTYVYLRLTERNREVRALLEGESIRKVEKPLVKLSPHLFANSEVKLSTVTGWPFIHWKIFKKKTISCGAAPKSHPKTLSKPPAKYRRYSFEWINREALQLVKEGLSSFLCRRLKFLWAEFQVILWIFSIFCILNMVIFWCVRIWPYFFTNTLWFVR